ncbi:MAG: VOC family protein [Ignavibacteria bacterium]|nr:VOC family protein [Ignavibacteria bacterium]
MKRVTGIGGIFFKCDDIQQQKEWYRKHLGIESDPYGAMFEWRDVDNPDIKGTTVWNPFKKETDYFLPSTKETMINYRVENLTELLKTLREEGVEVIDKFEEYDFGKFGWIMDPEGNKIELWEPVDEKMK